MSLTRVFQSMFLKDTVAAGSGDATDMAAMAAMGGGGGGCCVEVPCGAAMEVASAFVMTGAETKSCG